MVIRCLGQLALAYMVRVAPTLPRGDVLRWLDKAFKPVLLHAKKGFSSVPLQDVLVSEGAGWDIGGWAGRGGSLTSGDLV